MSRGSVVFFRDFTVDNWFARYFNPQTQWKHAEVTSDIDADLRLGNPVWLETTAADHFSAADPSWFEERTTTGQWHELNKPNHRIRFMQLVAP